MLDSFEVCTEMTRVYWTSCKIHIGKCKSHDDPENERVAQHAVEISTIVHETKMKYFEEQEEVETLLAANRGIHKDC